MHTVRFAAVALVVALTTLLTPAEARGKRTFVYVHDSGDASQVFAYEMRKTGALTALPGSPFQLGEASSECGGQCQTSAYSKRRKVLLTTHRDGVTAWTVAKDGSLTRSGEGALPDSSALGVGVVEVKKRSFAYVATNLGEIHGYEVEKDGSLASLPGFPVARGDDLIGVATAKQILLAINEGSAEVYSFRVGEDGALTDPNSSPSDFSEDAVPYSVHTDSRGRFVVVGVGPHIELRALDRKTGAITPVAGGIRPLAIDGINGPAVSKKGLIAVVPWEVSPSLDDLQLLAFHKRKGALSDVGGVQTLGMAQVAVYVFDLKGRFLVAASHENDEVRTFRVDMKAGTLEPAGNAPAAGNSDSTDIEVIRR